VTDGRRNERDGRDGEGEGERDERDGEGEKDERGERREVIRPIET